MSQKFLFILTVLISFSGVVAQAGFGRGNGGNVLVCEDSSSLYNHQILDLYELVNLYDLHTWVALDGRDRDTILKMVLQRVGQKDLKLKEKLLEVYSHFWQKVVWDENLATVNDSKFTLIPAFCHLQQIAVQDTSLENHALPSQPYAYRIHPLLFQKLSPLNQATLILHEMILTLVLRKSALPYPNSQEARHCTAGLLSEEFYNLKTLCFAVK